MGTVDFRMVGKRICELRKDQKVSQMQLAELAELSVSYVSMIENARKKASLDTLIRIANVLGVTIDELLNGNQLHNPLEYQKDIDILLSDCDNSERRIIYEFVRAAKEILRSNRKTL